MRRAGFLAQDRFPSLLAALHAVDEWVSAAQRAGREPASLAAFVSTHEPGSVLAKLGTRDYWLALGARTAVRAELLRSDPSPRVFILTPDGGEALLLEQAITREEVSNGG